MKTLFTILFGAMFTVATHAASPAPPKKVILQKKVSPAYQQNTSSAPAWAMGSGFRHELDLNLSKGYLNTYYNGAKNITDISVAGSYSYDIGSNFQVGGDAGFQSVDSISHLLLVGTGTYNLDSNYSDAIFFKAGLGLYPVTRVIIATAKIEDKNEVGTFIAAGKRFKIWDHVNYKPFVAITKISDLDVQFTIQFLNVSVNFN